MLFLLRYDPTWNASQLFNVNLIRLYEAGAPLGSAYRGFASTADILSARDTYCSTDRSTVRGSEPRRGCRTPKPRREPR